MFEFYRTSCELFLDNFYYLSVMNTEEVHYTISYHHNREVNNNHGVMTFLKFI